MLSYINYYVAQVDEMDCGVAALAMVLKHYGSTYSLAYLRQKAKTDLEGTSALGLMKTAESFDFETKAIQADMSLFEVEDLPLPFIAHVIKEGGLLHYYVVLSIKKNQIVIADPDPTVSITKIYKDQFASEWSGVAIFMAPKPTYKPVKEAEKASLWSFVPTLLKQKFLVIHITLAALLITIISILGSYFLQTVIDTYIPNKMTSTLGIVTLGLLVFYVFQAIFTYTQNFLLVVLGQRLSIEIILSYLRHVFELPMSFFATRKTGEIISRFNDANKIIDALASSIISIFLDVTIVVVMGIILMIQNTTLFWITLMAIPLYIAVITLFVKPFEKLNQKEMQSNAMLNSAIIEDLHGIETIKALSSEHERYQKIDTAFIDYLKKNFNYVKTDTLQQAIKLFIQLGLNLIVLWVGAILVTHNELSIGQLMTYNALLAYFVNPLQNIINLQTKLQSAKVANNRLNEVFLVDSEFTEKRAIKRAEQLVGPIKIENVSYCYGYGKNVLEQINLTIHPGEKLTIVGMSGSGKSTLVKLLVDFFQPNEGQVTINQHNITNIDKKVLRQTINYIPQDPYLFSGTILDNLKLGNRTNVTQSDLIKACELAEIKQDIEKMPLQFETLLDEEGSTLSGGQKQRLTIARALLSPAKVLIFDESTSGLDTITESRLVEHLMTLTDKTIIFIAHRLSIAKKTNNVIVMENGRIIESGSHDDLIAKKETYYQLINN
uniref:ABC exporter n=1 Tax=Latilactobacillus sakei TaxID=1599 RepID=Q48868_LATSK|nr:ABC exporter [Latilactobacillus sakei]